MMAKAPKQRGASGASAPAGDHHVRVVPDDRPEAVADGDSARGAAHPVGRVGPGAAELDGDVAARGAREDGQRERRIDRPGALGEEVVVLPLAVGHAAERGTHHGPDPVGVLAGEVELGVGQRHAGRGDGELGIAVQPPGAPRLDMIGGDEPVDLTRDPGLEYRRIEPGDAADRRAAPMKSGPQSLDAETDRGYGADAGDHHSAGLRHGPPPPRAGYPRGCATRFPG